MENLKCLFIEGSYNYEALLLKNKNVIAVVSSYTKKKGTNYLYPILMLIQIKDKCNLQYSLSSICFKIP